MSNNKRIAKNTMLLYIRMFFVLCINLYLSRAVLSALGVVDYGIYNVVAGVVSMFSFLVGSLSGAASRYLAIEVGKNDMEGFRRIFSSLLLIFLFFGVIIVVLGETVGLWFLETKLVIPVERMNAARWLYQFTILGAFLTFLQAPYTATIIAYERMAIYAYVGIGEVLLKLFFVFLLSVLFLDKLILWGGLLTILSFLVLFCFYRYCILVYSNTKFKLQKDRWTYRELLAYSGWDLVGSLSVIAQGQGINMVLNIFFGPVVNAARGIAYQVEAAINQFTNNFLMAVKPQLFKQYAAGDIGGMMSLVSFATKMSFILMYMLSLPILLELPYILGLWLGNYPDYTVTFTSLVLVNNMLVVLRTTRGTIYHAMNKIKYTSTIFGLLFCLALPVSYWFCRIGYPPHYVFYSIIIINILVELIGLLVMKYFTGYSIRKYFFDVDFRCFLLVLFTTFPLYYIRENLNMGFLRLLILALGSTIIILIFSYILCFTKTEKKRLVSFLRNGFLRLKQRG